MSYLDTVGVGDSVEYLKQIPDNSIDSCVTDPPYGLGKAPDPVKVMTAWAQGKTINVSGTGFMYKEWDAFVPQPDLWREVYRVLKPGAYLLAFFGTRTYDWGSMAIRFAGFEVVDQLEWIYGSGFPKSLNISKAIDAHSIAGKSDSLAIQQANDELRTGEGRVRADGNSKDGMMNTSDKKPKVIRDAPATPDGARWDGWGTALKPGHEPIVVARKPLEHKTFAENVLAHGTSGINVDGCRVATADKLGGGGEKQQRERLVDGWNRPWMDDPEKQEAHAARVRENVQRAEALGRFPPNVLLTHSAACELRGIKEVGTGERKVGTADDKRNNQWKGHYSEDSASLEGAVMSYGKEVIEDWSCATDCPVGEMDRQSGTTKSTGGGLGNKKGIGSSGIYGKFKPDDREGDPGFAAVGGASRYFPKFRYQPKPSRAERERGLEHMEVKESSQGLDASGRTLDREDGSEALVKRFVAKPRANIHPTVKPIELMRWLVRLVTQRGGVVLDPFMGSGTTGIAAVMEGMHYVGVEREAEYAEIANARIEAAGIATTNELNSGDFLCPGCKKKGEIKLISNDAVQRMKASGKKTTCMKCMKRYAYEDLVASAG